MNLATINRARMGGGRVSSATTPPNPGTITPIVLPTIDPVDAFDWVDLDNLANTKLALAHTSGSPSLVLQDATKFTPTSSSPRHITVIKADGSAAVHYLATGKVGNALTVTVADGYSDRGWSIGDRVVQSINNQERVGEIRDQIDALTTAVDGMLTALTALAAKLNQVIARVNT